MMKFFDLDNDKKKKEEMMASKVEQLVEQAQEAEQMADQTEELPAQEPVPEEEVISTEEVIAPESNAVEEIAEEAVEEIAEEAVEEISEETVEETAEEVAEDVVEETAEETAEEAAEETADESAEAPEAQPEPAAQPKTPKERQPLSNSVRLLIQALMAGLFTVLGVILLLSTLLLVYMPIKANNKALADQRLESRMELSVLIADVFPSMNVNDELSDVILRALDNKKATLRNESNQVAEEIEALRTSNEVISKLLVDVGYDTIGFDQIVSDSFATDKCLQAINIPISVVDGKLEKLGVAKLKEEIANYKGTTTTVTREDENGETITETVVQGGLIPEAQAKKSELQKKYDELQGKLDELDDYLDKNNGKITAMYNRLESTEKAYSIFDKMAAISAYAKENPKNNMFLQDTTDKLNSFPGESKEEDDILFIMKVESETGIRMQMVNYGQDYQHVKLSNGMLLCYEVYSIPYYASYQGLKNLIAYFNDNDDFYASVYTLSIQYNPADQSIQGNMVILHYYLLDENAEYVPPVIGEEIIPGIDGIFGDVTDNNKHQGKQSPYTVDDVKGWLDDGMSFEDVRDKLKSEGYPATEFAWIMKEEYKTPTEMQGFLEEYGEEGVEYDLDYVLELLECDLTTLMDIYYAKDPGEDDTGDDNTPDDPEEDTTGGDNTPDDPEEDTTGGDNTPDDPEEDTTGGDNTPDDPEEDTTGGGNTPDDPEEDTTGGGNTPDDPEEDTTGGSSKPNDPEEETTTGSTTPSKPKGGKQSDHTADELEQLLKPTGTKSLEQVRDMIKAEGYPATELAWILKEKYRTRDEIEMFVIFRGEGKYTTLEDATELFECTSKELKYIYEYDMDS